MGLGMDIMIGTCEYDIDDLLDLVRQLDGGKHCSLINCKLPIPSGNYGNNDLEIQIPEIPSYVLYNLAGKLEVHVSVTSSGKEIVCADFSIELITE